MTCTAVGCTNVASTFVATPKEQHSFCSGHHELYLKALRINHDEILERIKNESVPQIILDGTSTSVE